MTTYWKSRPYVLFVICLVLILAIAGFISKQNGLHTSDLYLKSVSHKESQITFILKDTKTIIWLSAESSTDVGRDVTESDQR